MRCYLACFVAVTLSVMPADSGMAEDDLSELRKQVAEQGALIQAQQKQLDVQSQTLDRLSQRLDAAPPVEDAPTAVRPAAFDVRDGVGDLNSGAVKAGTFPGSFKIPGPGTTSLALGGLVKTVVIRDSDAENMGADFLPSTLGSTGPDTDGATSLDSTLTRLFIDGRSVIPSGSVRGYVEYDLNAGNNGSTDFKLRHAYGSWDTGKGRLVAGHTWSTMMDLKILPEGLTEPTLSGVIFARQPIVRWSQPVAAGLTYHVAIEDPSSNDVFGEEPSIGNTRMPDGVLGFEYDPGGRWHVRLNSIVRDLNVDLPDGGDASAVGWGMALTGHLDVFQRDRLVGGGVYGEGLGRYFLGVPSSAGSALNPDTEDVDLRDNYGGMLAYLHRWSDTLRSSAMGGHAVAKPLDWQPADEFESTTYGAVNLMWSPQPYLTLGIEYAYGKLENDDGSELDNHRVAVGIQVY